MNEHEKALEAAKVIKEFAIQNHVVQIVSLWN